MDRKSFLVVIVVMICSLIASAGDDNKLIRVSGSFSSELNFSSDGNSVAFSSDDDSGKNFPANSVLTADDRQRSFWRNSICLDFDSEYGRMDLNVYTNSDRFIWPDSVGLKSRILMPVGFIHESLGVGLYHDSSHNLSEERYGKGTNLTGPYLSVDLFKTEGESFLRVSATHLTLQSDGSPFFFTKDAGIVRRDQLENAKWMFAGEWHRRYANADALLTGTLRGSDGGLAAMGTRVQVMYWLTENILAGPFAEYNFNLRETDLFGRGEWLFGPRLEVRF